MTKSLFILMVCLFFSCAKNEIFFGEGAQEIIDESTLTFKEGFNCRMLNTNILTVLEAENCILMVKTKKEENELVKYSISNQSNVWQVTTWYNDQICPPTFYYHNEDVILFRKGNRDFANNLVDGSLLYDEVGKGSPKGELVGYGYNYFSRSTSFYKATQNKCELIFYGDIRGSKMGDYLISPPYDTLGKYGEVGRVMGMHPFESKIGELLLAIRFFDFEPLGSNMQDLFAVYNVSQNKWATEPVPLEFHETGTQSIVANGLIYYGSQDHVSCIDTETGGLKWVIEASSLSPYSLLALGDESIFVRNLNGMLQRRNAETGELIWENDLGHLQRFIVIQDKLFSIGQNFTVTDIKTGKTMHSYSSPYVDYNPNYYFGNANNLMGYYDEGSNLIHVFININEHMVCYEIEN